MALTIESRDVEALVEQMVELTGESKTEAVRQALSERIQRLAPAQSEAHEKYLRLRRFMEKEVWSKIPAELLGKPIPSGEIEDLLGFDDHMK